MRPRKQFVLSERTENALYRQFLPPSNCVGHKLTLLNRVRPRVLDSVQWELYKALSGEEIDVFDPVH